MLAVSAPFPQSLQQHFNSEPETIRSIHSQRPFPPVDSGNQMLPIYHPFVDQTDTYRPHISTLETQQMSSRKPPHESSLSQSFLSCQYKTPTSRWKALMVRDHLATNAFVYAVLTTKIYCRPDCKARLARRANVVFYDTAKEAEKAGFRACKRCKPCSSPRPHIVPSEGLDTLSAGSLTTTPSAPSTTSSNTPVTTNENPNTHNLSNADNTVGAGTVCDTEGKDADIRTKIHHAVQLVRTAASNGTTLSLAQLSAQVGLSKWHLQRVFKRLEGVSPREMAERMVMKSSSSSSYNSTAYLGMRRAQQEEAILGASAHGCEAHTTSQNHYFGHCATSPEEPWDGTNGGSTHERIAGVAAAPTRPPRDEATHLASYGIISVPGGSATNGVNDLPGVWDGAITVSEPFGVIPEHGLDCHGHMDMNNYLDMDAYVDFDMDMDDLLADLFPELYRDNKSIVY
ncbi:hypothetical protein HRR83_001184 [Exophiala dermatitidis]|uniref:HTH araC/xylS-type domain-containing protein n=2 Tax=Exophiala dermatitidis TaxID=5970 RepID=H6C743_EXODN|nr:uncharacterized protein HMPREF1120_07527 [Exophiala dermatitidis NIH/UT8656]KAJ4525995.1 hypothetical protein HRR74_001188 [Exophiala dermatitidis]EHY59539.1 hypothetical protein HMPREF1120_07527 [Exophiala dermatitidis NIH/UT8656]KAJ4546712.1 hypothetical protein HRR77_004256 [Exophiala dermatitidis]KAJ4583823.1 hypothetical protein HRR82_003162 [Exophiala dermatitidis]KAJ4599573.1 hypothetical protein HRR84_003324 [Exophiala dermatitidis]